MNPVVHFKSLKPNDKRKVIKYLAIAVVLAVTLIAYKLTRSSEPGKAIQPEKKKKISFEPELLQKSAFEDQKKLIVEKDKEMAKKDKEVENLKIQFELLKEQVSMNRVPLPPPPVSNTGSGNSTAQSAKEVKVPAGLPVSANSVRVPPPPPGFPKTPAEAAMLNTGQGNSSFSMPQQGTQNLQKGKSAQGGTKPGAPGMPQRPNMIGGIGVVSQPPEPEEKKKEQKESKQKFYLPPSFMEATMLSGVRAPTLEAAKSQPRPVFLRIKDVAVLPNEIKSNLKGCFIIAAAYGDLSDERIHLRLEQLTCLAKNGQSVIDAKVSGVVIDADAQLGLAGTVVTKAGAMLGRTFMAGFLGGIGDTVKATTQTTSVSSLTGTTTQTLDADKLITAGVGGGLSSGFHKLEDFYLEMARQTFPVIETGATKVVTVAITQGIELSIKDDVCVGGLEECNKSNL